MREGGTWNMTPIQAEENPKKTHRVLPNNLSISTDGTIVDHHDWSRLRFPDFEC